MPETRTQTQIRLARETYETVFGDRQDKPEFPKDSLLEKYNFDILLWAAEEHAVTEDVANRLTRAHHIPAFPIRQDHPTASAQDALDELRSTIRIKPETTHPWLPLHNMGPYIVMGHYAPSCKDFSGIPDGVCIKVLIRRQEYERCYPIGMESLTGEGKPQSQIPIEGAASMGINEALLEIRKREDSSLEDEDIIKAIESDPLVQQVEDMRMRRIGIFPHDTLLIDDITASAIPRDISLREPLICYDIIGTTCYVLSPKPSEVFKIQDELNQSAEDQDGSLRIIGVYAEEASIRAMLDGGSREMSDLTLGDTNTKVASRNAMVIDAAKLSVVEKSALLDDDNANLFAEWIIYKAIASQASDIHIERVDTEARVRYRINGSLIEMVQMDLNTLPKLLNVIKILCSMPVTEKRKVMDGTFQVAFGGKRLDARVSMIPHFNEMTCVIRVNSRGMENVTIDSLQMTPRNRAVITESASVRTGIVFITGPTGSGKTTTLYALLNQLNTPDRNLVTIEEPVEYHLPGIKQFQINRAGGLDYGKIFKGLLRHDPDVILIGEIRDEETAKAAVTAAHTGHLVFTTLHTNNAAGVVPRMLGLGIEPSELADALVAVQAQRLVRVLCPHCSIARKLSVFDKSMFSRHGMAAPDKVRDAHPHGCRNCNATGYTSRVAIMETMPAVPAFVDAITSGKGSRELIEIQRSVGYTDLFEEGLLLAARGITTMEEAGGWKRAFSDFENSPFSKIPKASKVTA